MTVKKQTIQGVVTSDKMALTVVVKATVLKRHPLYHKQYRSSKRYKAHNPENQYHVGDTVQIEACRPLSKDKRWIVISKVK